jgi:hypothetical protein
MPYLSLGIFLDRTILQPDEQQPLLIERKDQLVIVPGMSGRPGPYDLFVNRAELLPVVTEGFRGDFEGRKTEPSGGAGRLISETTMDEKDPMLGGCIQKYDSWLDMTTTLPDVLASDGKNVYMRSLPFDMKGNRRRISHFPDELEPVRLFSPTGFLEDHWFHRSYWTYARCFPGGWNGHLAAGRYNPSGRLLVTDDSTIYGYGRKPSYYRWTTSLEYRLFATEKKNEPRDIFAWDRFKAAQAGRFPRMELDKKLSPPHGAGALPEEPYDCLWEDNQPPLLVRAMVSGDDCLFVAGPRDVMDEKDYYFPNATDGYEQDKTALERQSGLWTGKDGAVLHAVRKSDGTTVAEQRLDAIPVFDGMIAAEGKLFISLENGHLICLDGARTKEK